MHRETRKENKPLAAMGGRASICLSRGWHKRLTKVSHVKVRQGARRAIAENREG